MTASLRWAWFALACAALALWCVLGRYQPEHCRYTLIGDHNRGACFIHDRWTGRVLIRFVAPSDMPPELRDRRGVAPAPATIDTAG